jgi:hypothetical protein
VRIEPKGQDPLLVICPSVSTETHEEPAEMCNCTSLLCHQ